MWYINFNVHCKTNPIVRSLLLMEVILGVRKILIVFNIPYRIHSLTDWQRVSIYKDYGLAGHLSINIWSTEGISGLLSTLSNLFKTMRNMIIYPGLRNLLQSQEEILKDDQIYFCNFVNYREVSYRFPKSGKVPEGLPDLLW